MKRHAAAWTPWRRLADKYIGRSTPGKHHPIWDLDLQPSGLIRDLPAFTALARQLAAA
ncbi:hypothetical protein ACFFON_15280 [Arthrobacter citreus]|uniref:hypothetical protein n=1 Tax=Arthrobacter TaxID=1663 RepID=UPI0014783530|nr:hypothetical protein [Arthrobacter gandavensis]